MENTRIAQLFDEIADLLELKEDNEFRVRSYRNAAQTLRGLPSPLIRMTADEMAEIPNIGKATSGKIREILDTGTCQRLEELRKEVPKGLTELMHIPGIGPRTAMRLNRELGVTNIRDLKRACQKHQVSELKHMGKKSEEAILAGIATVLRTRGRLLYSEAAQMLESLGSFLSTLDAIALWKAAGSFRRGCDTIGDLDILVQAADRPAAAGQILKFGDIADVLDRGPEWLSVRLVNGLQVDFRFLDPAAFGSALLYFTGSKAHNIHVRRLALDRKWKLNEYGLFSGNRRLAGETEESLYSRLGLAWIPPELREDRGEIEAARKDDLPVLIDRADIRGDLHAHTTVSDGKNTIADMAAAAMAAGWSYLAITDHSKRIAMVKGLGDEGSLRHADDIRKAGSALKQFRLLAGIEVDILRNGSLDLKARTLEQLDWVVASAHVDLNLDRTAMTDRILAAVKSGLIHCLGHPLGRHIGRRDSIQVDMDRVIEACVEHGVRLEINCQPDRLDLPDVWCKRAQEAGAGFVISTDAHSTGQFALMRYGINVARRGWLTAPDVLNTIPLSQLQERIQGKLPKVAAPVNRELDTAVPRR